MKLRDRLARKIARWLFPELHRMHTAAMTRQVPLAERQSIRWASRSEPRALASDLPDFADLTYRRRDP
jgi:hypothetical protein